MKELNCKCTFPSRDSAFSICLDCCGQLGAYHQCINCTNYDYTVRGLNIFKCKHYGFSQIKKLKKQSHCAMQEEVNIETNQNFIKLFSII